MLNKSYALPTLSCVSVPSFRSYPLQNATLNLVSQFFPYLHANRSKAAQAIYAVCPHLSTTSILYPLPVSTKPKYIRDLPLTTSSRFDYTSLDGDIEGSSFTCLSNELTLITPPSTIGALCQGLCADEQRAKGRRQCLRTR